MKNTQTEVFNVEVHFDDVQLRGSSDVSSDYFTDEWKQKSGN